MSSIKLITVGLSALFLATVSMALQSAEMCLMAVALVSVPAISCVVGRIAVRGLKCSRESPQSVREGEPIQVRIHLHGQSRLLGSLQVEDNLPEWIVRDNGVPSVAGTSSGRRLAQYSATAIKRGEYTLGPPCIKTSDPLGFFRFECDYPLTSSLVVLPRPMHLPDLHIWSTGSFGDHQFDGVGARGSGIEFHGVREYQSGDELRRVHWRSSARHGRLNVVELEHSEAQDTLIALDVTRGSEIGFGRHSSLEYAVRLAGGVAESALMTGSQARLVCAGVSGPAALPDKGPDHLFIILDALARVKADREESLSRILFASIDSVTHGSNVVCLASSVDEGLPHCAEMLRPRGARLHLILIVLPGISPEGLEREANRLVASGAGVTVVHCSADAIAGHVVHRYAT